MIKYIIILGLLGAGCYRQPKTNFIYVEGPSGQNGTNGTDGKSCNVTQLENGALIQCETSSAVIYNGTDGKDGQTPSVPIGISSYIKPCGEEFDNDEILLRLTDGKILALYDGGNYLSRLVLLAPGSYITTDRTGTHRCTFTVNADYSISN